MTLNQGRKKASNANLRSLKWTDKSTLEALLKEFDEFVHQSTLDGISIEEVYKMIKEWITKAFHQGKAVGRAKLIKRQEGFWNTGNTDGLIIPITKSKD